MECVGRKRHEAPFERTAVATAVPDERHTRRGYLTP